LGIFTSRGPWAYRIQADFAIINELMHRVTRRVLNLTRGSEDDWKEAEFWQALCEMSEQGSCLDDLVAATSQATGRASN